MTEHQMTDKILDARGTGKITYPEEKREEVYVMDKIIQQIWRF